jgi:hypothetical protein
MVDFDKVSAGFRYRNEPYNVQPELTGIVMGSSNLQYTLSMTHYPL